MKIFEPNPVTKTTKQIHFTLFLCSSYDQITTNIQDVLSVWYLSEKFLIICHFFPFSQYFITALHLRDLLYRCKQRRKLAFKCSILEKSNKKWELIQYSHIRLVTNVNTVHKNVVWLFSPSWEYVLTKIHLDKFLVIVVSWCIFAHSKLIAQRKDNKYIKLYFVHFFSALCFGRCTNQVEVRCTSAASFFGLQWNQFIFRLPFELHHFRSGKYMLQ